MGNRTVVESKIRHARQEKGFTVAQLAQKIGVAHVTLSLYELGQSAPSERMFKKLKLALDLQGGYLDYFNELPQKQGRRRKYSNTDTCKWPGCKKQPRAKGYCYTHYVNKWKKRKKKEQDRILHDALEQLALNEGSQRKG